MAQFADVAVADVERMSAVRMREVLRHHRQVPQRRSRLVVRCGERIANEHLSLGSDQERHLIYEQVAVAAIDCNQMDLAEWFLGHLKDRFGAASTRVQRLSGMLLESQGKYREALQMYEAMRKENPTSGYAAGRIAAVYKAQGFLSKAIEHLEQHLGTVQTDEEIWKELLSLYIATGHSKSSVSYGKAMNACEELILQDPHNHVWHCIYGELLYSSALELPQSQQKEQMLLSRKYFSQSLVANDAENNSRAVWGLWQTSTKLVGSSDLNPSEKEDNEQIHKWAVERLVSSYKVLESSIAGTVARMLKP